MQQGNGACQACAKTGYDPSLPGYLYYVTGPRIAKVGITNHLASRLTRLRKHAPTLLDVWEGSGRDVQTAERHILTLLRHPATCVDSCYSFGERFGGATESWFTSDIRPTPPTLPDLVTELVSRVGDRLTGDPVDLVGLGLARSRV